MLISLLQKRRLDKPLYLQIGDEIREQIVSGVLKPGDRLPSTRTCASEAGVSRTSIIAAFEQLRAEGYLSARQGSGYYVNLIGALHGPDNRTLNVPGSPRKASAQKRGEAKRGETNPQPQAGHPGAADMRLFPYRQWAKCVARTARLSPHALIDVVDPFGDPGLRESITRYLREWRGMDVSPQQIIVTAGSIEALEICVRTLVAGNSHIALENPGYLLLRNFIEQAGLKPVWLAIDKFGAQVPKQTRKKQPPTLAVITPSHQFPLGTIMSPNRRNDFINWADQCGSWIIEDDYDSEFRYSGQPIPALTGMDRFGRSIYVGSFAKIFSSGLRLGFLVSPVSLQKQFASTLNKFSSKASVSMQRPLANFMDSGEFYRHIRRVRRIYGDRRALLIEGLQSTLKGQVTITDYQAGTQLVAHLPDHYDDVAIARAANDMGVAASPLTWHYAGKSGRSGKSGKKGLVLGFCAHESDEVRRNVAVLRQAILKINGAAKKSLTQ